MKYYSIEYISDGTDKGLIKGERFGYDGLTEAESMEVLRGYLAYKGRVRLWRGMTLLIEAEVNEPVYVNFKG